MKKNAIKTNGKIVAAYVRVSTIGQNEAGQVEAIKAYCQNHNLEPVFFIDKATGNNLDRPEFNRLNEMIFRGEVSTVLIYKLDRLSRKLHEGIMTLTTWLESGVRLVSITQSLDFSGSVGKMIAAVLLGVAEMEQETRRERQFDGIQVAKTKGVYKGRKSGTEVFSRERIIELRERGLNYDEISTALNCSKKTIQRALKKEAVS